MCIYYYLPIKTFLQEHDVAEYEKVIKVVINKYSDK